MSDDVYTDIVNAFNKSLLLFQAGAYAQLTEFENVKFVPPDSGMWLRQKTFFNPPVIMSAFADNNLYRINGIYQVNVMAPAGSGIVQPRALAAALAAYFKRGTTLTEGSFSATVSRAYAGSSLQDDTWVQVPVSAEFYGYSAT